MALEPPSVARELHHWQGVSETAGLLLDGRIRDRGVSYGRAQIEMPLERLLSLHQLAVLASQVAQIMVQLNDLFTHHHRMLGRFAAQPVELALEFCDAHVVALDTGPPCEPAKRENRDQQQRQRDEIGQDHRASLDS